MVAVAKPGSIAERSEVEQPDVSGLVTEDDTPVDNIFSEKQQRLLTEPLYSSWSGPPPEEGTQKRPFAALANVGLFPTAEDPAIVPDMMLSLDVELPEEAEQLRDKKNRSYFVWKYGKPPEIVVEIVSNREGEELGEKLQRYRRIRISYYVVYDPMHALGTPPLRVFEMRGDLYVPLERAWFESVGLGLVEWQGTYEGMTAKWLRWCTRDGGLIATGAERAEAAEARAEAAESRAETAESRAERLAARLRELGIDPDRDL